MQTDATGTILTERRGTHGDYREHAQVTQAVMDTLQSGPNWRRLSACQRESLHMFAHKMGRIVCGDPDHVDHWDDIAGYARLVADQLRVPVVKKAASVSGQTTGDAGQNGGVKPDPWLLRRLEKLGVNPLGDVMDSFRFTGAQVCDLVREVREDLGIFMKPLASELRCPTCQKPDSEQPHLKCILADCYMRRLVRVENLGLDLYTGPVQDFAAEPPPWPHITRSVVGALLGAEKVYLPDRSRIDPEVVEEQLCRLDGKLPRLDYESLHPALRTLYAKQAEGEEFVLLPEFAGWAS